MYLDNSMRVLTVGDGDLTFSRALFLHKKIEQLTVSVLDKEFTLVDKYSENGLADLRSSRVEVEFGVDVTNVQTFPRSFLGSFDLVIFQFPLIPHVYGQKELENIKEWGSNGLNRALLYKFLQNAFETLLDPNGSRLVYISSKDVKPYCDWDIENLHEPIENVRFLGWSDFALADFPGYTLRNVERDKKVKSTAAKTYVWSDKAQQKALVNLNPSMKHNDAYCQLCGNGPFYSEESRKRHEQSKRHGALERYDRIWRSFLTQLADK